MAIPEILITILIVLIIIFLIIKIIKMIIMMAIILGIVFFAWKAGFLDFLTDAIMMIKFLI